MFILNSLYNCFYPEEPSCSWYLPEGASENAHPKRKVFECGTSDLTFNYYRSWKVTVLNHTDFKISIEHRGRFDALNDIWVEFQDKFQGWEARYNRVFKMDGEYREDMVAYHMEGYPNLFFFEIKCNRESSSREYYIDTEVTFENGYGDITFAAYDAADKITEISQEILKRKVAKKEQ